jgi:4-alpha-glucanotransferase
MTVIFRIQFYTHPGQALWLSGEPPLPTHPVPMEFADTEHWQLTVPLPAEAAGATLNYSYVLMNSDGSRSTDWGRDRKIVPAEFDCAELLVLDSWNQSAYIENVFYTEPFKKVLLAENFTEVKTVGPPVRTHTFRVKWPLLKKNQTLCLLGEGPALGNWNPQTPVLLGRERADDYFSVALDLRGQNFPLPYKYGVFDVKTNSLVRWEDGPNRILWDEIKPGKHTLVADGFARLPLEHWRGAGVAIPVFSLRTESSFGTGEFADLKPFADWGKNCGLKLIQLLPINDTSATGTWHDSYPYAAISAFALHPLYLNLAAVANAKNRKLLKELEPERQRLNALDALDYEAVMKAKLGFLRKIFPSQKAATFRSREYKKFFEENKHWLTPYAAFCFLRDKSGTSDFNQWPEHNKFDAQKIAALAEGHDKIAFHCFIQFHLHSQLQDAAAHVHAAGLVLKGDIAIGVFRHGADAWQNPELFHMDAQAGAPPDAFSAKGQNWGFPTYNWGRMAADGFAWWKQRFAQMGNYFDAFRIDHILGFFRIWSSPAHAVEGILGYFVPALAIEQTEFGKRGIHFDRERLTKPFITDAALKEIFGADADYARREFLLPAGRGAYSLKPDFATQRQVEKYFAGQSANERNGKLKIGLFDLISNVILLEVDGKFHFRFSTEDTLSFKALPPEQQKKLKDLYLDYFFRRQDDFWMRQAMQKLPALKRVTNMLICGEDLGLVPACVPDVMHDLAFLALEVQRMPKRLGQEFSRPADAPYLSVATPGTHDMSTIRGWWQEDRALIQKFYNHELHFAGEAPADASPEIVQAVVRQHLASPGMWSIFQLQDLAGMDAGLRRENIAEERINVPAVPNFYWRYRMHRTVEALQQSDRFNSRLKLMIAEAGR